MRALPSNPQEMLQDYVEAKKSVICEFSGNISGDMKLLKEWHDTYIKSSGLLPVTFDWSIYIHDEDD